MPYTYDHSEEAILDGTQRGLFNSFVASTWTGSPNNVISAVMRIQGLDVVILEVVGTKNYANETVLPDPPLDVVDTDGTAFTVQFLERGTLNPGQIIQMNNFISSVWPGAVSDVTQMEFLRVLDDDEIWQMRAILRGTLSAATSADLPHGKRFRVKTKT